MTTEAKIVLSESEVAAIECGIGPMGDRTVSALCATVKALRARLALCEGDVTAANPDKWGHESKIQLLKNRLSEAERERDRFAALADARHDQLWDARRQRDDLAARCAPYLENLK